MTLWWLYNNQQKEWYLGRVFEDLKSRGVKDVGLIVSDGLNSIEEVAQSTFQV